MGSIRKRDQAWQARYRGLDGRQHAKTFQRKGDAQRWVTEQESAIQRGAWADPTLARTLVGDWIDQWQKTRALKPATRARDESVLTRLILPVFADTRMGDLKPVDIKQWVAELSSRGYAPATVRKAYQILSSSFKAAVNDDLLVRSPCRGVSLPKMNPSEMRFLDVPEVEELAEATGKHQTMVLTAAYTGLRFGELTGLRVGSVDLMKKRPSVTVTETLNEVRGKLIFGEPKTSAGKRTVALPGVLADVLAVHLEETGTARDPAAFVFSNRDGGPLRRSLFRRRVWLPAVAETVGEPCRFHDLRHTHAAILIKAGQHPKVIQQRLGHASIRTTLDTYGHLFEGLDEAAAEKLDEMVSEARVDKTWTKRPAAVVALTS